MSATQAPTMVLDVHRCPTRLLRVARGSEDTRATVVSDAPMFGASCKTCTSTVADDAQFCGMCGDRVRGRVSLVGTVLDDLYRIERLIAEGSTATIYSARYLPSGATVALKVLHSELALDGQAVTRFRREGRCLSRLRDPRTVTVFDHAEAADGTHYIAMELLRGEGLDVRLRTTGAMSWRTALKILRDIGTALVEMHGHGIVHRGLALSNVVLVAGDAVKLIDFGLAKLRPDQDDEDLTGAGHSIGTLRRVAPEQLLGGACDARADLYALGVIGCQLLLGRMPPCDPAKAVLPAGTPAGVAALLRACVLVDPAKRIPSAVQLVLAIDQLLATSEPSEAPALTPRRRRIYGHTPAFELLAPRIVVDPPREPAFVSQEVPAVVAAEAPRRGWALWATALAVCGIGLGTAVAGCM